MAVSGIFFDLDGTLVDSLIDICSSINHIRKLHGLSALENEAIRKNIGKGVENLIENSIPELLSSKVPELVLEYRKYYSENPSHGGKLYPGVATILKMLRLVPNLKLGLVTNKTTSLAEKTVERYLPGFKFDIVAGPEIVTAKKPDARHLLEVLAKFGIAPQDAWFIGDDPVDRDCAKAAGVSFLGASYGIGRVEVPESQKLVAFYDILAKIPGLSELRDSTKPWARVYKDS